MKRTLPFFMLAILVTLFINPAFAQVNNHIMTHAQKQAFIEKAVMDYSLQECFYICDGITKVPVKKWKDGKYHTADGAVVPDSYVHCFGKAVDKVATANSTANRAERKAEKAQKTANEAMELARKYDQQVMLDSMSALSLELSILQLSYVADINNLNGTIAQLRSDIATDLDSLRNSMPKDQSQAIADLQWQTSELGECVEILIAHDFSTSSRKLDKIVTRAIEVDPNTKIIKRFKR